jgi:hypothetical protein
LPPESTLKAGLLVLGTNIAPPTRLPLFVEVPPKDVVTRFPLLNIGPWNDAPPAEKHFQY